MAIGVGRGDAVLLRRKSRTVRRRCTLWAAALVIPVSIVCTIASARPALGASPAAEAESLIRDGVALRREQRDVQALPLFQKAYDLVRNARTAGQLGLCELSLGYWIEAEQ